MLVVRHRDPGMGANTRGGRLPSNCVAPTCVTIVFSRANLTFVLRRLNGRCYGN